MRIPRGISKTFKYALGPLLAAVFLFLTFRRVSVEALLLSAAAASYPWMAGALATLALANVFRAWRWNVLLSPVKDGLPLWYALASTMIGYLVNVVVPRGGEIARTVNQARLARIPVSSVLGSIVVERVLDVVALLVLLSGSAICLQDELSLVFPGLARVSLFLAAATAFLLALIWVMTRCPEASLYIAGRVIGRVSPALAGRVAGQLLRLIEGFSVVQHRAKYAALIISSVLVWACYVAATLFAFVSFGLFSGGLRWVAAAAVTALGGVAMTIPVPGGAGTYHYFVSRSLEAMFGVEPDTATACATTLWTVMILIVALGGAVSLVMQRMLQQRSWSKEVFLTNKSKT